MSELNSESLEQFKLGVPEIDHDHAALVELMVAVAAAASTGNRERCQRLLDRFIAFAETHFLREERLLKRWKYPTVDKHAAYHDKLLNRAKKIADVCTNTEAMERFEECCTEMMSFVIDDFVRGDLRMKSFLQNENLVLQS